MGPRLLLAGVVLCCLAGGLAACPARGGDIQAAGKAREPRARMKQVRTGGQGSLVGTSWQLSGTNTTIDLLPAGQLLWDGKKAPGSWQQKGRSVTIDVDAKTRFELVRQGEKLVGIAKALQGKDAGVKRPVSLR